MYRKPPDSPGVQKRLMPMGKTKRLLLLIIELRSANREFWCRGYYVDTVGKNTKAIAEYIKHQLDEDRMGEQMTMLGKSNNNPFTGSK